MKRLALALLVGCGGEGAGESATETETDTDTNASADDFTRTSFDDSAPDTFPDDDSDFTTFPDDDDDDDDSTGRPSDTQDTEPDTTSGTQASTASSSDTDTEGDTETDPTHGDPGDCCDAHPESTGCENAGVEACVCAMDAFCCETAWDDACTVKVVIFGCAMCEGIGGDGDCCDDNGSPGCDDDEIEACVCLEDIPCCLDGWDQTCVDEVEALDCGKCA